jgi:tetrahydromethanopterin S-methyltransferase subunit E
MIKAAEAQTEFWRELRLDIAKKGVWGLLVVICGLILVGVSAKLGFTK